MTTEHRQSPIRDLVRLSWRQALWAVPFAIFFGTLFGASFGAYLLSYRMSLVFTYCIGLGIWATRHFIVPRCAPDDSDSSGLMWRIGSIFAAASLISSYLAAFIIHVTIRPGFLGSAQDAVVIGMWTLLFATLFTGINYAIVFHRQALERARQVEQIRAELAEAELRALRAQVNPHFLFNTLNSIASLVSLDPAAAEDVTTRLAEVFRYALRASDHEHARFADEIAFLRSYLEIERARLGDRLRLEEEIEGGLDSLRVPSLLLQPLVENAVRHGIAARPDGGTIRISAARRGDSLVVEIADDGPGMEDGAPTAANGFGLRSVRERLRASGADHVLEIHSERGRGTRVRVRLPLAPHTPSTKGDST